MRGRSWTHRLRKIDQRTEASCASCPVCIMSMECAERGISLGKVQRLLTSQRPRFMQGLPIVLQAVGFYFLSSRSPNMKMCVTLCRAGQDHRSLPQLLKELNEKAQGAQPAVATALGASVGRPMHVVLQVRVLLQKWCPATALHPVNGAHPCHGKTPCYRPPIYDTSTSCDRLRLFVSKQPITAKHFATAQHAVRLTS